MTPEDIVSEPAAPNPPNLALICPECGTQRTDPSRTCPACGAPPLRKAGDKRTAEEEVRNEDLEPYVTLRYIARLFKILAVLMVIMLIGEVVSGLAAEGTGALMNLIGEATKFLVIAGLMWSGGDVTLLLIDAGHDLRVARILLGRINATLHERGQGTGNRGQ
jgi:zinc-ribbon domain